MRFRISSATPGPLSWTLISIRPWTARVETEIGGLNRRVDALNRDPHTIERLARERLGMVRPGETVFLFDGPAPDAPAQPGP